MKYSQLSAVQRKQLHDQVNILTGYDRFVIRHVLSTTNPRVRVSEDGIRISQAPVLLAEMHSVSRIFKFLDVAERLQERSFDYKVLKRRTA